MVVLPLACSKNPSSRDWDIHPGQGIGSIAFGTAKSEVERTFRPPDEVRGRMAIYTPEGLAISYSTEEKVNGFLLSEGFMGRLENTPEPLVKLDKAKLFQMLGAPSKSTASNDRGETLDYSAKGLKFVLLDGKTLQVMLFQTHP